MVMSRLYYTLIFLLLYTLMERPVVAQFKEPEWSVGFGGGGLFGLTEGQRAGLTISSKFRPGGYVFLRRGFAKYLQAELSLMAGQLAGSDATPYKTTILPVSLKLIYSPWELEKVNPYFYAGGGAMQYRIQEVTGGPQFVSYVKTEGFAAFIPAGLGLQIRLNDELSLETVAGYSFTLNDNIDYYFASSGKGRDALWSAMVGVTYTLESGDSDPDVDGLPHWLEKRLDTDRNNPDSDGDGLTDGDEYYKYKTNPRRADTDDDGLNDAQEILVYKTDSRNPDTDGDGLSDGDEILRYKTHPMNPDTDGDGLSDGDEVFKFKTDPLNRDTDGDGLTDGDEVLVYLTDPLKADTDGGGVSDGEELRRGTNPLNPRDDAPKREELKVGKRIVLEGVNFKIGSADITAESVAKLEDVYQSLRDNPEIEVEISGHTDNTGSRALNSELSLARADAVKTYLVGRGINSFRIRTKGYGPDRPVGSNSTAEGRAKNRRIEFTRIK
jgi:outer membrane protein OmpA-like peptidoglycan-associated protein